MNTILIIILIVLIILIIEVFFIILEFRAINDTNYKYQNKVVDELEKFNREMSELKEVQTIYNNRTK